MGFVERSIPPESSLDGRDVESAWFSDSYHAGLDTPGQSPAALFEALLGHNPRWAKGLLILRNRLALRAGLAVAPDALIQNFERKSQYAVGDAIGPWPIFYLSETELIAGRNNDYLNFRFSVLKLATPVPMVAYSTLCNVHNRYGKIYLFFIAPFHRFGMRHLMRRAIAAGRL
jgi:hypothetical protein